MTVTIDLRSDIEARLAALAAEQGVSLAHYLGRLFGEEIPARIPLSPAERAAFWRKSAKNLPHTPPLSDEAISRESLYDARA